MAIDDETPITFPAYVMETMFEPGDNPQHMVETVIANLWRSTPLCAHVFDVMFIPNTGTWECAWTTMTKPLWEMWLRGVEHLSRAEFDRTVEQIIKAVHDEEDEKDA